MNNKKQKPSSKKNDIVIAIIAICPIICCVLVLILGIIQNINSKQIVQQNEKIIENQSAIIANQTELFNQIESIKSDISDIYISVNESSEAEKMILSTAYSLPDMDTSFKAYMDYRAITDKRSKQFQIQEQAWTDEYGFRRINNDYIVAMGTHYATECGARFKVTFDTGNVITVTVGDIKADIHTDTTNRYSAVYDGNNNLVSANVLEFIVDENKLPSEYKVYGSVDKHSALKGNIKTIEKIYTE